MFAVLFALSCMVAVNAADANAEANENNVQVVNTLPDTINVNYNTNKSCEYCGKVCADSADYAAHLVSCDQYSKFMGNAGTANLVCYYCGAKFKNEKNFNLHCATYVNVKDHVAACPYSGEDYLDLDGDGVPGCPCTFNTKAEYDAHKAQCPYKDQYSTIGYLHLLVSQVKDLVGNMFKGIDWGGVLGGLKAIFAGFDLGALKDIGSSILGALGISL